MKKKSYSKPVIVAQNNKKGSFAAGCPEKVGAASCKKCERTK